MKNRFLALAVLLMSAVSAFAVDDYGKLWSWGINAELGLSNVTGEGDKPGFGTQIGVALDCNINSNVFAESGLIFNTISHSEEGISGMLTAVYAKLPLQIGIKSRLTDKHDISVQVGPTFLCGLYGTTIHYGSQKFDYFDLIRRFDVGIEGKVGLNVNNVRWTLGVNYGMISTVEYLNYHNLTIFIGGTKFF